MIENIIENFSQIISAGVDPLATLALLVFSGDLNNWITVVLVCLVAAKILLNLFRTTKVVCDATLGKIEYILGIATVLWITLFHLLYQTYEQTDTAFNVTVLAANGLPAVFGTVSFAAVRTLMKGVEASSFIFALIPGTFAIGQIGKYIMTIGYVILAFVFPVVAAIIGVFILVAAVVLFFPARRLGVYFRRIYISSLLRSIFARNKPFLPVMLKIPKYIRKNYQNITFCQEAFVMRGVEKLPKRQRIYIICNDGGASIAYRKFIKWHKAPFDATNLNAEKKLLHLCISNRNPLLKKSKPTTEIIVRRELGRLNLCDFFINKNA
ncbi:MAG: hypothetical protein FWE33_06010 [Defluviitaleaceae bacterium]|nr:hypothetical protein [Defluviitaleaceae bacterium]